MAARGWTREGVAEKPSTMLPDKPPMSLPGSAKAELKSAYCVAANSWFTRLDM